MPDETRGEFRYPGTSALSRLRIRVVVRRDVGQDRSWHFVNLARTGPGLPEN